MLPRPTLIVLTEDTSHETWKLPGSICYDFKFPSVEHLNPSDLHSSFLSHSCSKSQGPPHHPQVEGRNCSLSSSGSWWTEDRASLVSSPGDHRALVSDCLLLPRSPRTVNPKQHEISNTKVQDLHFKWNYAVQCSLLKWKRFGNIWFCKN